MIITINQKHNNTFKRKTSHLIVNKELRPLLPNSSVIPLFIQIYPKIILKILPRNFKALKILPPIVQFN
jgi:hypothetical protein